MKSAHIILLSSNVISRRSHVRKNHTFKLITVVAIGFKSAFTCNRDEIPSKDEKFLFTREFHPGMKRVQLHPRMKFNLKENLQLSMKT